MTLQRHVAETRWRNVCHRPIVVERRKSRRVRRPDGSEIKRPPPPRPERRQRQPSPWWMEYLLCEPSF